jgi:exopolysaccharide production protein ExoQ
MVAFTRSAETEVLYGGQSLEKKFLFVMFILIYAAYSALGRDIFVNRLDATVVEDPIGAILVYFRIFLCFVVIVFVSLRAGVDWSLSIIPITFMPFVVLALASSLWAEEPRNVFRAAVVLAMLYVALPLLFHRMGLVECVKALIYLIAFVVIASAALAIFIPSIGRHTGLELFQFTHSGKWRGIFSHKNGLGPWAAYGSVFLFTHGWLVGAPRVLLWMARASAVACLIFSGSATALIAAFALLGVWVLLALLRRHSITFVALIVVGSLLCSAGLFLLASEQLFALLNRDLTFTGRSTIWEIAVVYFYKQPWFGYGYQTLGGLNFLNVVSLLTGQPIPGPENGYLTILLDLGIVGFLLFFVPIIVAFHNAVEWLKCLQGEDRACLELISMIVLVSLIMAVTESNAFICTGFYGVITFGALFALISLPRFRPTVAEKI